MSEQSSADVYAAPGADVEVADSNETYEPKIFSFSGRIGRLRYVAYNMAWSYLPIFIAGMVAALIGAGNPVDPATGKLSTMAVIVFAPAYLMSIVGAFAMAVRRFNDLDKTGWLSLLFIVPFVNIFVGLYLLFAPGSEASNNYGAAPCENSTGVKIAAFIVPAIAILGIVLAVALPAMMGTPPAQ